MKYIFLSIIGLANGIIVGSGIVALVTMLDIIPRLAQLSKTNNYIYLYENTIVCGATITTISSILDFSYELGSFAIVIIGLSMGVFIGLLASALAEVLNVIPVLVRRFQIEDYLIYVVYSLIFGKMIGSFVQFLILP